MGSIAINWMKSSPIFIKRLVVLRQFHQHPACGLGMHKGYLRASCAYLGFLVDELDFFLLEL